MSFKIDFDELKFFKDQLKSFSQLERAIPDISSSIQLFNHVLETRVEFNYATPGSLSDVMIGKSVKPTEVGKTFLRYGLQYRDKPIPLVKYPHEVEPIQVESKYPKRRLDGGITWRSKEYALQVNSKIRKGQSVIARSNRAGKYKGFLQADKIFARKVPETWREYPSRKSDGVRAYPLVELYGPSLATVAAITYDKDDVVQKAKDKLGSDILNAVGKWYI